MSTSRSITFIDYGGDWAEVQVDGETTFRGHSGEALEHIMENVAAYESRDIDTLPADDRTWRGRVDRSWDSLEYNCRCQPAPEQGQPHSPACRFQNSPLPS